MPTLYLVRHGEPTATGLLLGRTDAPLSELGRRQMASLEVGGETFYTSTLQRARESAVLCAKSRPVVVLADLDEMSHGEWDGLSWSEVERHWPALASARLADWTGVTPPGGERWEAFTARIDGALEIVLANPHDIAVVGHVAVNAWIAYRLAGVDPTTFQQAYGAVRVYEFAGSDPPDTAR